jgi:dTDP-4-dehydrorhamnose reductase
MDEERLAVWGGFECTRIRVGRKHRDQILETGHEARFDDLLAVAALGLKTLRYPVLWEKVAPKRNEECDWNWHDQRLGFMQNNGIELIAGLVHHGSGPAYTSLLSPEFPVLFARYAEQVARRYPWIERYTPINEPLTTARFSGLYGHWHPHRRNMRTFLHILVNQCKAIRLAMSAIRHVNSAAQLVQTEDVGKAFATRALRRQADYENERRWLSLDLLAGRVDATHPWRPIFQRYGIEQSDLELFADGKGSPNIIGFNHYLTSERYLDERVAKYPAHLHGGRRRYVDLDAARVEFPTVDLGPTERLRELWARYKRPIAITEVHHDGTRDEQLRWLVEVWKSAHEVRAEGADIRAVTVWSLVGAVDWNSLLREKNNYYESGAFDIRAPTLRTTAIGQAVKCLSQTGWYDHPVLDIEGWWRRPGRYHVAANIVGKRHQDRKARALLIIGASGVAKALCQICKERGLAYALFTNTEWSRLSDAKVATLSPWAVVSASAYVRTPSSAERCWLRKLGSLCSRFGWPLLAFSSDRVFSGLSERPYNEYDNLRPQDEFGAALASIEKQSLQIHPNTLIARCGPILDASDPDCFGVQLLSKLKFGRQPALFSEVTISPAYVPDLINGALDLLIDGERGIWHLANRGHLSLAELANRLCKEAGLGAPRASAASENTPRNFALVSRRGWITPTIDSAISRFSLACSLRAIARHPWPETSAGSVLPFDYLMRSSPCNVSPTSTS